MPSRHRQIGRCLPRSTTGELLGHVGARAGALLRVLPATFETVQMPPVKAAFLESPHSSL